MTFQNQERSKNVGLEIKKKYLKLSKILPTSATQWKKLDFPFKFFSNIKCWEFLTFYFIKFSKLDKHCKNVQLQFSIVVLSTFFYFIGDVAICVDYLISDGIWFETFKHFLFIHNDLSMFIWHFMLLKMFGRGIFLTEVAGEGGPDLAPQTFLLFQKFRHLMRCKKYLEKNFLSCLVSEIQLFVYIFG